MTIFYSILAGIGFGALGGGLKYCFLWRPLLAGGREMNEKSIMTAEMISMAVNVVWLLAVFFLRNVLPFSFMATIVATAVVLSLFGKLLPMGLLKKKEKSEPPANGDDLIYGKETPVDK